MIRTAEERMKAVRELWRLQQLLERGLPRLLASGIEPGPLAPIVEGVRAKIAALEDILGQYYRASEGELPEELGLADLGRRLIELRIAEGLSQRDLARRLGVGDSTVSRDERSGYAGVTIKKALRVLEALGVEVRCRVVVGDP